MFARKVANNTDTSAMLQRTLEMRIKRAPAIALPGQNSAIPFGARVPE
jgi:hypothetical protein